MANSKIEMYITPISSKDNKKHHPNRDYNEQMHRAELGKQIYWDGPENMNYNIDYDNDCNSDYFIFWFYKKCVKVHKIINVYDPNDRLPSWSDNVGHQNRPVVELSDTFELIDWDTYINHLNGYKRCMGTTKVVKSKNEILNFISIEF